MASIDVISSLCPGYAIVALRGELDISDETRVARALSAAAARGSPVIVDLAALTFIDCCGLSALVSAWEKARRVGGDLLLAAPQQPATRLLSLIDVAGPLPVFASAQEATNGDGRTPAPAGF
jgi:anti-sigma B factor antagonist